MNASEKAALIDFVDSVVWPGRTVRTTTASEDDFNLTAAWNVTYDLPNVWVNGNKYTGAVTWNSSTSIHTATAIPAGSLVVILVYPGSGANYLARTPGSAGMNGNLPLGGNRVTGLGASVDPSDAVRRDEVEEIAEALIGANYLLKSGGTMTGAITLAGNASSALHAVPKQQVALLDGSQAFTAPQSGVTPTTSAHLATKDYVDSQVSAVVGGSLPPNRKVSYTTPGQVDLTGLVAGTKYWAQVIGGSGGPGGHGLQLIPGGDGGPGAVEEFAFVLSGTTMTIITGGGGYKGLDNGGSGTGGAGGGGGGAASQIINGSTILTAGGGGGGGGGHSEGAPGENGGNGGAGGTDGQSSASAGGTAGTGGTLGDKTANGGVGGSGGDGSTAPTSGGAGTASSVPSSILSQYNEDWAFPVTSPPAVGLAKINSADNGGAGITRTATDGGHGSVTLRWYEA